MTIERVLARPTQTRVSVGRGFSYRRRAQPLCDSRATYSVMINADNASKLIITGSRRSADG